MEKTPKHIEFAYQITAVIEDALNNEDNPNHISLKEEDLTEFIHALATVAPTVIYCNITGDNKNNLEFNHIANLLCFQFMKPE